MGKPVLFVDNDFLIDIYGRQASGPWGANYDPKLGAAILDDLSKKYEIHITSTVLEEAIKEKKFAGMRDWFDKNVASNDAVRHETPGFTGKDKGERSIASVISPEGPNHYDGLPANTDDIKIATRDNRYFKNSPLGDLTLPTQFLVEQGLADGTIARVNYDALEAASGEALRKRGGFKTSEQVYAEHGITPPAAETVAPAKPPAAASETKTPVQENPVPESKSVANVEPPAPESSPAKTAQTSKFIPEGTPAEAIPTNVKTAGVGNAGASSLGIVLGAKGLHDAIKTGDTVEGAIASTNIATSTAQATEGILTAAGKSAPLLTKAGKFIPGVNVGVTLIDGAYQISKEDTPEHMAERTAAVTATAATAIGLGTATATAAEAGVITAGVTGVLGTGAAATGTAAVVVAAPVVVTVAAVAAVAYTGEKAIEAKRAWDDVDKLIAENGAATKRRNYTSDDGKPSVLGYKHIAVMMLQHSEHMKSENMNGTGSLERNQKGRFKIEDFKQIDMRDPKNIAELERVLKESIAREDKIIKDNDSILPRWMRGSDSADKMTMAQMERADLVGAAQELEMYKKDLKAYDAAHPDDPATTPAGGAPQKPKPNSWSPS